MLGEERTRADEHHGVADSTQPVNRPTSQAGSIMPLKVSGQQ